MRRAIAGLAAALWVVALVQSCGPVIKAECLCGQPCCPINCAAGTPCLESPYGGGAPR